MRTGLGIDTGGTYTDAVIYDYDTQEVLAKAKTPTTRSDLTACIGTALDLLPHELLADIGIASLSTTLATNACVENKGCRAKLLLLGTTKAVMKWIDAEKNYGLRDCDVLCVDTHGSFDGSVVDEPDWNALLESNDSFFRDAGAIGVAECMAVRNGAVCEKHAKEILLKKYGVPVIAASELVNGLNVMERGATALLNARLLPVIAEFSDAVSAAMSERGLKVPTMTVRSDGGIMTESIARERPVETVLSGPAASVLGGKSLTERKNCLIIDMGGTTTDISVVTDGIPASSDAIRIGGWHTQVRGVFIDTFGLGGDSRVTVKEGKAVLETRRVTPICAAAAQWSCVKKDLAELWKSRRGGANPLHEFLWLVKEPSGSNYTDSENELISLLRNGPIMVGGGQIDPYTINSERLESEGAVMRAGFTPTDAMHIKGDYSVFDREAAVLAAGYLANCCMGRSDDPSEVFQLADEVYEAVGQKLHANIARVLICERYPFLKEAGPDFQITRIIEQNWENRHNRRTHPLFDLKPVTGAALVGIGAPTHIFLPEVAAALEAECVIPENAEVANAIGAATAEVTATVSVEVTPNYTTAGVDGYSVHSADSARIYETSEEAVEAAKALAARIASAEAKRRGCNSEPEVIVDVDFGTAYAKTGSVVELGATVTARAFGQALK